MGSTSRSERQRAMSNNKHIVAIALAKTLQSRIPISHNDYHGPNKF